MAMMVRAPQWTLWPWRWKDPKPGTEQIKVILALAKVSQVHRCDRRMSR